jgi:hypothetical protein
MHQDDIGAGSLGEALHVYVELLAAYCLGEIALSIPSLIGPARPAEGWRA